MNHYEVLGVRADAPVGEIRKAYLERVLAADEADRQDAAGAWAVLRDPERRRAYDRSLRARSGNVPPAVAARRAPLQARRASTEPAATPAGRDLERAQQRGDLPDEDPLAETPRGVLLMPPFIVGFGVLLVCLSLLLSSGSLMLVALIVLAVGVGLFILIPLFEAMRTRAHEVRRPRAGP